MTEEKKKVDLLIEKSLLSKKTRARKKKQSLDRNKYKINEIIKGDVDSIFISLLSYSSPYTLTQIRHIRLAKYLNHKGYDPMQAVMLAGAMVMEAMYGIKYKNIKTDVL
jgi:hypothetical protein